MPLIPEEIIERGRPSEHNRMTGSASTANAAPTREVRHFSAPFHFPSFFCDIGA